MDMESNRVIAISEAAAEVGLSEEEIEEIEDRYWEGRNRRPGSEPDEDADADDDPATGDEDDE